MSIYNAKLISEYTYYINDNPLNSQSAMGSLKKGNRFSIGSINAKNSQDKCTTQGMLLLSKNMIKLHEYAHRMSRDFLLSFQPSYFCSGWAISFGFDSSEKSFRVRFFEDTENSVVLTNIDTLSREKDIDKIISSFELDRILNDLGT